MTKVENFTLRKKLFLEVEVESSVAATFRRKHEFHETF